MDSPIPPVLLINWFNSLAWYAKIPLNDDISLGVWTFFSYQISSHYLSSSLNRFSSVISHFWIRPLAKRMLFFFQTCRVDSGQLLYKVSWRITHVLSLEYKKTFLSWNNQVTAAHFYDWGTQGKELVLQLYWGHTATPADCYHHYFNIQFYTLSFVIYSTYPFVFDSIKITIDNLNKANCAGWGREKQLECTKQYQNKMFIFASPVKLWNPWR